MARWRKIGLLFDISKILNRPEWFFEYTQAPNVVDMGDFLRIYFSTRGRRDTSGNYVSLSTFVDLKSIEPLVIKEVSFDPILDLGEPGCFDEHGIYPISVLRETNRFLGVYGGWSRCESVPFDVAIGLASSVDGRKFSKHGTGPILAANEMEPFVIGSPKLRFFKDKYYLTYIAGREWTIENGRPEIYYKLRMASSENCIEWKRFDKDIIADRIGPREAQACGDIFEKNGNFHMWFCFRNHVDFRENRINSYRIGYARSENLIDWERMDIELGLDVSETGWDSQSVSYPNVFSFRDQIYMLYLGNHIGRNGFGIAKLSGELE